MNKVTFEVCCGSVRDCVQAESGGADRVELNSALHMGGLTPSIATMRLARQSVQLPIIAMVRPRGGGFHYDETDIKVMMEDALALLEAGADGIAFGFLNHDCTIDEEHTNMMCSLIHQYHKEAVFHRAFDCVSDPYQAMEQLIKIGIDRVLTSGLQAKACDGKELIKCLQEQFGERIEILAGSGVHDTNAYSLMEDTKVTQIHSSCKDWVLDPTTVNNQVTYAYADEPHTKDYDVVSSQKVMKLTSAVRIGNKTEQQYKHVIFDIDGTLINNEHAVIQSLQDTLKKVQGKEYTTKSLEFALGITGENALIQLGVEDIVEAQRIWDELVFEYLPDLTLFNGIYETIQALKEQGMQLGIVSSKTKSEFAVEFESFSITPFFDTIILSDDTKKHKPNPEPILAYLEKAHAKPEETLYIGDSIYDMQCAASAHVDGALALWGSKMHECDLAKTLLSDPWDVFTIIKNKS